MKNSLFIFCICCIFACSKPTARRPISNNKSTIIESTIAYSIKRNKLEEQEIIQYIKKDTIHSYKVSPKGFWYFSNEQKEGEQFAKSNDIVTINYSLKSLDSTLFYSQKELGEKEFKIDKEDFIPALQDGLKLMRVGETMTFIIPSYRAFGLLGDQKRIGSNQTILSKVTLLNIK